MTDRGIGSSYFALRRVSEETDLCPQCTDESCCLEYERSRSADGLEYRECIETCTKSYSECVLECEAKNHDGHVAFAPYLACAEFNCVHECAAPNACASCDSARCADHRRRCSEQAQCATLTACVTVCQGSTSCESDCKQQATTATVKLFDNWIACGKVNCAEECG
jgi:hypothetical protein